MKVLDTTEDQRVKCVSIMTTMLVAEYLELVTSAYNERGGIEGQRGPLKTRSAMRIRNRMVDDLKHGAVLPPVVIGVIVDSVEMQRILAGKVQTDLTTHIEDKRISIIDGMQRTTALIDAMQGVKDQDQRWMRVEFWLAESANSLIYRMLILNAGQIPWSLSRQLNVVFFQFIEEAEKEIQGLKLIGKDAARRRAEPGQYQASDFVQLFLLFGTRRDDINLQDQLADEFARLDLTDSTSHPEFIRFFFKTVTWLVRVDNAFSRASTPQKDGVALDRFKDGKDIFSSHPARIGFVVAFSQQIMGDPGVDLSISEQLARFDVLKTAIDPWIDEVEMREPNSLRNYLSLPTLDEIISRKRTGKVGEYQRQFFLRAYSKLLHLLLTGERIDSMEPCWRAHI